MKTAPSPFRASASADDAHSGMILRFVDAFPSAADAVKHSRKSRSPGSGDAGAEAGAGRRNRSRSNAADVLVLHL